MTTRNQVAQTIARAARAGRARITDADLAAADAVLDLLDAPTEPAVQLEVSAHAPTEPTETGDDLAELLAAHNDWYFDRDEGVYRCVKCEKVIALVDPDLRLGVERHQVDVLRAHGYGKRPTYTRQQVIQAVIRADEEPSNEPVRSVRIARALDVAVTE